MTEERKPANEEMVQGYMDGYDLNAPEPSANRSYSYRHGFAVGRAAEALAYPTAPIPNGAAGCIEWRALTVRNRRTQMADVIQLDEHRQPPNPGNGALEAVNRYLKAFPDLVAHTQADDGSHFLAWLWQEGFKVVPVEPSDLTWGKKMSGLDGLMARLKRFAEGASGDINLCCAQAYDAIDALYAAGERKDAELARLRGALEWYAEKSNYELGQDHPDVLIDGGSCARCALEQKVETWWNFFDGLFVGFLSGAFLVLMGWRRWEMTHGRFWARPGDQDEQSEL
jgi:hypothetical protein